MTLPYAGLLEALSLAELRDLVGVLIAEVRQVQSDNALLQDKVEAQQARIMTLQTENQALRDEVARLKGLPPRPPIRPSGMEKATEVGAGAKERKRSKQRRGAKRDRDAVTKEIVVKAKVPAGSRFKGFEDILVRDLQLSAEVIRYRRERWLTPMGETVVAPLPTGIVGGFGPELRRFLLAAHIQGQVTMERLTALLNGIGVEISKRQVVRLLSHPLDSFPDYPPRDGSRSMTPAPVMPARRGSRPKSAMMPSRSSELARRNRGKTSSRCSGVVTDSIAQSHQPARIAECAEQGVPNSAAEPARPRNQ
jgi:hypothetical protein